ncbi:MAG: 3-deoxy-manno-octulosonate cytidylyltransferase [Syntrophorhabdales bacterium]|jgi:3-deoxy-manno-octulosonate cytidylyltransferase (CMP-KDO synthetase)
MKKVIVIPARYGSTRLPGKVLLDIAGKPIIQWVYERACESTLKDRILVATDDERIQRRCAAFGALAVMTGPECRSGTDRVYEAIKTINADVIVNLQGDEPEIRGDMIDALFRAVEQERLDMATLCSIIDDPRDYKSPHVVKCVADKNNFALYFSRAPLPFLQKNIPIPLYKHIGIYGFSRSFLETFVSLPKGRLEEAESLEQLRALEAGYRIKVIVTEYEGTGIDTEADLERARKRMKSAHPAARGGVA